MTVAELTKKYTGHVPSVLGVQEHYAVLVPLVEQEDGVSLLFEVRAQQLRHQPGDVCFPGGRVEAGEDAVACALRETEEELGIPADAIHPIALLDVVHGQSGFLMHPVLARVDACAVAHMTPAQNEVEEAFLVPLTFFEEHEPLVYTYPLTPEVGEDFPYALIGRPDYPWRGGTVEIPIYCYEGRAIWGMTGRVVHALVKG